MKYLPAIDGLRAIAVLAVVADHAGLPISAGYVGVDAFFVISGYVITRMLLAEPRIDLAAFYARRVRRILPALLVVIAATLALSSLLLAEEDRISVGQSIHAALTLRANVYFQMATGDYFDQAAEQQPLLHLWSLAVEEQFYLVWPLLIIAFRRRPWLIAALTLASFTLAQHWVGANSEAAFYQMPARFWELGTGGLIAFLPAARSGKAGAILGLALVSYGIAVPSAEFPGMGALAPVIGTGLALYAVHCGKRIAPLEWKPVRYVGLVSYSFYLWHWPLLALNRATSFDEPPLTSTLGLCGVAFLLACASYHFIETPFRKRVTRAKLAATMIAGCVATAGCSEVVETALRRSESLASRTSRDRSRDAECQGVGAACRREVVLWGDSHARAWQPLAEVFGRVHQVSRPGCPASTLGKPPPGPHGQLCVEFNRKAVAIAQQAKTVVLGGYWLLRLSPNAGEMDGRADFKSVLEALPTQRVIVVGPIPAMPALPQRCIRTGQFDRCSMTRSEFEQRAKPVRAFMLAEIAKHPNVEYIEPVDYFCDAMTCPMMKDGYSLFFDLDHITVSAATGFAKRYVEQAGNESVTLRH